ncbi:glycoside hydrolase [Fibrobacter sp. UWB2]|uniref:endo-1,4-beta-xylanase n=1 Tax=Fibrobacter sp. UWB2 TaxID=1964358 RepID=UPI000B522690|nr:endo-1,4-beta-xylanase [Fibrobacter sp. UWB2]OWV22407.1 glycoside hydrolase [Fibrobacter sp. UWB2]
MNKVSTVIRVFALAIAASTFSFAGVGMADGAAKFLGNTTTLGEIPDNFGTYWNQITAENECVWGHVEKTRGEYDWTGCDFVYNWAKKNKAIFSFHTLLWGSQNPQWLIKLDIDETKKAWTDWIDAVKEHYPDLEMIEVVNEAVKSGNNYHSSFTSSKLVEALGGDNGNYEFVVTAFKMARERWPEAILIYNDYNTIQWQKIEGIDLLKKIKAQGAPVDAYGMQFHETTAQGTGYYCLNTSLLKRSLYEAHEQTGLPIYITQYDVGSIDDEFQKKCYQEHLPILMETDYVAGITLWGYIYGKTWLSCNGLEQGCSGLIKDGVERPALTWLKEYFKNPNARYGHGIADGAYKFLGNMIADNQEIPEDFQAYWNQVSPENACTWTVIEKERGKYDWTGCDRIYYWAQKNNVKFNFRSLLWGTHTPSWLNNLDIDETKKAVENWFDKAAMRYPAPYMIEVVNGGSRDSYGHYHSGFGSGNKIIEALGGDNDDYKFIATAFKMARKRWPKAILTLNDYDDYGWKNNQGAEVIKKIQEQGAPVDAYQIIFAPLVQGSGPEVQCFSTERIQSGIQEIYDKIKLPLFITEYSVGTNNDSLQKACYSEHIPLFMESEYIAGVNLWGYLYETGAGVWADESNPGLIKDGVDRPAMTWLKEYFKEHWAESKNMSYNRGIERHPLDSLDSIALEPPIAIDDRGGKFGNKIRLEQSTLQNYDVFDIQGVRLGKLSAYGFSDASTRLKSARTVKSSGIYFLRNRTTGKMQSVRVAR